MSLLAMSISRTPSSSYSKPASTSTSPTPTSSLSATSLHLPYTSIGGEVYILRITSLLRVLHAAHHSWLVTSPWEERGGIILDSTPGSLKTTCIYSLECYADVLCVSDINVRSLKSIRDSVLSGRFKTLAFGEMEKLYARNPNTASNIEANLKMLIEEGLRHFSHDDPTNTTMPARCLVIAGITPSALAKVYTAWKDNGFLRRFLRFKYTMYDDHALIQAVHKWQKIRVDVPTTWNGRLSLEYDLTEEESQWVIDLLRDQPSVTPSQLLKKIAVVLKEIYPTDWMDTLADVAPALGKNGALLRI